MHSKGRKLHIWMPSERALLRKHYADHTNKQLAEMVNAMTKHPVPVTHESVQGQLTRMLLTRPKSFWSIPTMAATQMKKGCRLSNGKIPVREPGVPYLANKDKDGYVWYVKDPATGKCLRAHRWVWEQQHGPIPPGMLVRFEGPKTDLSRLKLISRGSLQHISAAVMKNKQSEARKKAWVSRRKNQATRAYTHHTPYQFHVP